MRSVGASGVGASERKEIVILMFCIGDRVRLVNLKTKRELNGCRGIIIQEAKLKGDRFGVQIVETKKRYRLKEENLRFGTLAFVSTRIPTHTYTNT